MALSLEATHVKPTPELPPRVGFADAIIDSDGNYDAALASKVGSEATKYSLPLLLAEIYLRSEGIAPNMVIGLEIPSLAPLS